MIKKKILLPTKRFFKAPEESVDIRVDLSKDENLLRENEKNIELNITELYNKERNDSKNYKIYGKIKMIFKNYYSGTTSYTYLKDNLYLNTDDGTDPLWIGTLPYNEFAFLREDVLTEINTPLSGNSISDFTQDISTTSKNTKHTIITPMMAPYQNWNIYLSYVYSGDTSYPLKYTLSGNTVYDFIASDGIPFRVEDYNSYYKLTSPVEHGIEEGEYITLYGGTLTGTTSGRTFYVDNVGDEIYRSEKFVINLYKNQFPSGTTLSTVVFGKRCININDISGTTSQYYVHKHKVLTTVDDYILDKIGFESSIWEDERKLIFENFSRENDVLIVGNKMESLIYDFKKPFTLSGITNNLGYTPTEVYTTIIFRNGNGLFEYPPKVGYKFNFHDTWIDQHFSGTSSNETSLTSVTFTGNTYASGYTGYTFKSGVTLSTGTTLVGAFVEYNPLELKERIVSESFHKIYNPSNLFDYGQTGDTATFTGSSVNNPSGLYYQTHHRVKLRELSPYIETFDGETILNLPENAKYDDKIKKWRWRDLYDHGYIDADGYGTDFPFVNNTHYVTNNINFYLKNETNYSNKIDGLRDFNSRYNRNRFDC